MGPGFGVALEEQIEDGHEVRFTGAEAAVEEGNLAFTLGQAGLDEGQGALILALELGRHDVLIEGFLGMLDAFGEFDDDSPAWILAGMWRRSLMSMGE